MDYANLLSRAWYILRERKQIIALGVLVSLGSAELFRQLVRSFSNLRYFQNMPSFPDGLRALMLLDPGLFLILAGLMILVTFPLWLISNVARGALVSIAIAPKDGIKAAWSTAWAKRWRLLGIGLIASLPGLLVLLISGLDQVLGIYYSVSLNTLMADTFSGLDAGKALDDLFGFNLLRFLVATALLCPLALLALMLQLTQTLADRTMMLEDRRVLASLRQGWRIFWLNQATSIPLLMLVSVIWISASILLLIPESVVSLCCVLWPIMWVLTGTLRAYLSIVWTLAWQQWSQPKG